MVWDPKDPWGKRGDSIDDAVRQAQDQLRQMMPSKGLRSVVLLALLVVTVWQSTFIVAPDEEGVVKRFGDVVRTSRSPSSRPSSIPRLPSCTGSRSGSGPTARAAHRCFRRKPRC